ncbi:MAG TPA: hypothetical protein VNZ48_08080 [Xanthobacteraceae bacterium]|jgi:hypothetical protein|nr:hypothetical protein [Xanthobacteraceae bacterium]
MASPERLEELWQAIHPIQEAPSLNRSKGLGGAIVGRFRHPDLGPVFIGARFYTVMWIPIVPGGLYAMSGKRFGVTYQFYGEIKATDFMRLFPGGMSKLILSCFLETVLSLVTVTVLAGGFYAVGRYFGLYQ